MRGSQHKKEKIENRVCDGAHGHFSSRKKLERESVMRVSTTYMRIVKLFCSAEGTPAPLHTHSSSPKSKSQSPATRPLHNNSLIGIEVTTCTQSFSWPLLPRCPGGQGATHTQNEKEKCRALSYTERALPLLSPPLYVRKRALPFHY